jgi:uncharacterized protein (DUF1499 family)
MGATNRVLNITVYVFATLLVLVIGRMVYLSLTSAAPDPKLVSGSLRPCPQTPNCVSSEVLDGSKKISPFRYSLAAETAWAKLKTDIETTGGKVLLQEQNYMWATYTSRLFRFVDDMEFRMLPEEKIIHVRSGSRVGKSDIGVNRKNVEKLRKQFTSTEARTK